MFRFMYETGNNILGVDCRFEKVTAEEMYFSVSLLPSV